MICHTAKPDARGELASIRFRADRGAQVRAEDGRALRHADVDLRVAQAAAAYDALYVNVARVPGTRLSLLPCARLSIAGPRPSGFAEFEANNTALEAPVTTPDSWVTVPALNLNTNTVTIALWLQPKVDPVNDHAGLFFTRQSSSGGNGLGFFYTTTNQLGYTWNLGSTETSQFASGLVPPAGQWSFAALVVEPTRATIYLGGSNGLASATNAIPHIVEAWDGPARIGDDDGYWNDNFPGRIDEVSVFNYALSPAQISNLYNSAFQAQVDVIDALVCQRRAAGVTQHMGMDREGQFGFNASPLDQFSQASD